MSVIVKNMEMPERCGRCFFVRWSNLHQTTWCTLAQEACFEDFSRDYKNRRADFCPLVEIPIPHGQLIDVDELVRIWRGAKIYGDIEPIVNARPTVIEAEER